MPFAQGSNYIRHFRQAFALDERRARYAEQPYIFDTTQPPFSSTVGSYFAVPAPPCSVKEVWFAGSHSNVGGGEFAYDGDVSPSLSNLSFKWMVREAVEAGIQLDHHALSTSPVFAPFYTSAQRVVDRIRANNTVDKDEAVVAFVERCRARHGSSFSSSSTTTTTNHEIDELACAVVFFAAQPGPLSTADALALRGDHLAVWSVQSSNTKARGISHKFKAFLKRVVARAIALGWWTLELSPTLKVTWDVDGDTRRWRFRFVVPLSAPQRGLVFLGGRILFLSCRLTLFSNGSTIRLCSSNLGRGRLLPPNASFHYSVKTRLDATSNEFSRYGNDENVDEGEHYTPSARFRPGQSLANVKFVE